MEYSYHFPHGIVVSTASTRPRLDATEAQAVEPAAEPAAADAVVAAAAAATEPVVAVAAGNYYFICNSIMHFPVADSKE